jgi:Reverse transcriptase (RNA-dependent DNA polymerase)
MVAGPEFGHEEDKTILVVKALYGLKSASFSFRSSMAEKFAAMNFQSTITNPDVWLWAAVKGDSEQYCKYVLMYVDDILVTLCDAKGILEGIQGTFKLKNDKIEAPEFYLGVKLQEKVINGFKCWTITSLDYVKAAVNIVEESFKKNGRHLPMWNVDTPMNATYIPELDVTEDLNEDDVTFFHKLSGVLRRATGIGRVDI